MPFIRWLLTLLAIIGATAAVAQDYPARPAGPVLDQANILPPQQEAALDARLREYNARTGRAVVIATVTTLGGEPIETYAVNLFQQWGIGGAKRDQGLLLLVAPAERKVRIEVGYGLTPYVTDILSGRIIRDTITPAFRAGDYPAGIAAGVDALLTQLDRSPEDAAAIAEAAAAAERNGRRAGGSTAGMVGGAIFWGALILGFALMFGRKGKGRRRHRRYGAAGAVGDVLLWSAVSSMMNNNGGGGFGGGGGGGGGFGGFGGGMSGGGGASGSW
ncbi:TPM domain-containing protein [Croceibacterium ferulae]|uniref:TPM domain-containing protein n=1 Tax=Croceibacterium ferulae TaxID=1854641 RepID=UPI001F4ECB05|nr:TPM domain-containing protein [Croceibacterium ferulae]